MSKETLEYLKQSKKKGTEQKVLRQVKEKISKRRKDKVVNIYKKLSKPLVKHLDKALHKRVKNRRIIKKAGSIVEIKEVRAAPYVPVYFKDKFEEEKRNFFFK